MARNDSFNQQWASAPAQFERPGDGLIARGWAGGASEDPPEAKWENWWHNRVDLALQELQNLGQLMWFADAPYQVGTRVNHGGNSYIALSENTGVEPTGSLDVGVWRKEDIGAYLEAKNNLSDLTNVQTALANLTLTTMGIGLPTQATLSSFDWQNFIFTSGGNYQTNYTSWLNPPLALDFVVGTGANIAVDYVTSNATRIGLTVIPDTGTQSNYRVFKVLAVGAPGARVFTVRQEWNSAIAVPISGGGTGATTAAGALINLGLGEGSLVPIGVPFPYPLATAPANFLKVNGSSFSTTTYPLLAAVYPSGVLPDLRGYAIRGWDDGRGVDTGRVLLSEQQDALQNIMGTMVDMITSSTPSASGVFSITNNISGYTDQTVRSGRIINYKLDASLSARTAAETRMRNIAFNYIVRAM